jgi:endoglucanase
MQVGDPAIDHVCWFRPENANATRPSLKVDPTLPGSEVAAETAAAMAAASLVFRATNATYADLLVSHAKQLFNFSTTYRASYSVSFPAVQAYYNSTGFGDDLLWGATWLYYATGDNSYLAFVTGVDGTNFARWGVFPSWFSWDNKLAGVQVR